VGVSAPRSLPRLRRRAVTLTMRGVDGRRIRRRAGVRICLTGPMRGRRAQRTSSASAGRSAQSLHSRRARRRAGPHIVLWASPSVRRGQREGQPPSGRVSDHGRFFVRAHALTRSTVRDARCPRCAGGPAGELLGARTGARPRAHTDGAHPVHGPRGRPHSSSHRLAHNRTAVPGARTCRSRSLRSASQHPGFGEGALFAAAGAEAPVASRFDSYRDALLEPVRRTSGMFASRYGRAGHHAARCAVARTTRYVPPTRVAQRGSCPMARRGGARRTSSLRVRRSTDAAAGRTTY
jgi:hypothetical protein